MPNLALNLFTTGSYRPIGLSLLRLAALLLLSLFANAVGERLDGDLVPVLVLGTHDGRERASCDWAEHLEAESLQVLLHITVLELWLICD